MSRRLYSLLLRAFPRAFRERFAADMADTFADRMARARRHGRTVAATTYARAVVDTLWHGLAERRLAALARRRRMSMWESLR